MKLQFFCLLLVVLSINTLRVGDCDLNKITDVFDLDTSRLVGVWFPVSMSVSNYNYNCYKFNFVKLNEMSFKLELSNQTTNHFLSFLIGKSETRKDTFVTYGDRNALYRWYTIVDTDYDNYLIAIYCISRDSKEQYFAHISSRTESLPNELLKTLQTKLNKYFNFEFVDVLQGYRCSSTPLEIN